MMEKHWLKIILLGLILLDLSYSFHQYLSEPIDGDVVGIVLPSEWYESVLSDPFGIKLLLSGEEHAASNRYFVHQAMSFYMKKMPRLLQFFFTPIESVYLAIGFFKLGVHLLILYLLALFISGKKTIWNQEFLIAAALITPLFQASGVFTNYIGMISSAVTYVFSYSLTLGLLLLFFLPFYQVVFENKKIKKTFQTRTNILLVFLMIVLTFSGPLIQPVVLLICPASLIYFWWKNISGKDSPQTFFQKAIDGIQSIPPKFLFYFFTFSLLCLYSFYLGTFNAENGSPISIAERFERLGNGIIHQLTGRFATSLLLIIAVINTLLLSRFCQEEIARKTIRLGKIMLLFSIIYVLLLPLGGYREYRPNIVRADTLMPVILCLFFYFGKTSLLLIHHLKSRNKKIFLSIIIIISIVFTLIDVPNFSNNQCEKKALAQIAASDKEIVILDKSCLVMSWDIKTNPDRTRNICDLLLYWNIIKTPKRYSQQ